MQWLLQRRLDIKLRKVSTASVDLEQTIIFIFRKHGRLEREKAPFTHRMPSSGIDYNQSKETCESHPQCMCYKERKAA